jgi:hypothetical protein
MMKPLVKKKANPAFKRLQVLPLLPDLSTRLAAAKAATAAPAVVIVATRPEISAALKSL